jgi:hypothetical protein
MDRVTDTMTGPTGSGKSPYWRARAAWSSHLLHFERNFAFYISLPLTFAIALCAAVFKSYV